MLTLELPAIALEIPNYAIYNTQPKSDWLSRVLQADWLLLENNQ